MKFNRSIIHALCKLSLAAVSICGFCSNGHSISPCDFSVENNITSPRDSLIQEMTNFIQLGTKLSKSERRHIEGRIKEFPHRVLRRDTASYFINTAYAVAYYEFYKHDYKKAKQWVEEFEKYGMPGRLLPSIFRYSAVGINAINSLNSKGKLKNKEDKNSWFVPLKISFSDSLNLDFRRTPAQFIDSYLDDVPMDCNIVTYRKLLKLFREGDGRLELLNGFLYKGFIQRCVDAGRTDVLSIVKELWGVELFDFTIGNSGYLEFNNHSLRIDSASITKLTEEIISLDPKHNREQIDSLLTNGHILKAGSRVLRLMYQYYGQSRFMDLVKACELYNAYLSSSQLNTLHNYWGLALSNLGRYEEALQHYDIAILKSTNEESRSTTYLNKACTLAEMGRVNEAISLFMANKDFHTKPLDCFVWNDNLGYIYSFIDPMTALYYYNEAEKFLDSGSLYSERKIRHFCRKAQVLQDNKYLQRISIDEAMKFTQVEYCPAIAKGMAYTELGSFNMSSFAYGEADKNFTMAYKLFSGLSKEDRRVSYLNLNYAQNLCNLNRYEEAIQVLIRQLETTEKLYGHDSPEYLRILQKLLLVICKYPVSGFSAKEIYEEYIKLRAHRMSFKDTYNDIIVDVTYGLYNEDWAAVKRLIEETVNMPLTSMQRLELYRTYEETCRKHCSPFEYGQIINMLIPKIKMDVISGILLLTGDEKRAMQLPVSDMLDGAIYVGSYDNALELSLFRKGLLFATRQVVERKLATDRKTKDCYHALVQQRKELNSAIEYNDTVHIPMLAASVASLERKLNQTAVSDKEIYSNIDKTLSMITSALGANDLAVDFIKYRSDNEYHYGAFIIDAGGLIKFVVLGKESELKVNPNQIWCFLNDEFTEYSNVYFSTDGFLNNTGIEYFVFDDGTSVAESFNLHRVFHLSDIKEDTDIGKNIVVIGVSDHNSPLGQGESIDRGSWTDLPNVKYEMQLITNTLERLKPRLIFNDEASEQTFRSLSGNGISTLHISTHGFFRSSQMLNAAAMDSSSYDFNIARRFLAAGKTSVSGLVLRQGNLSWQSPEILEEYDDLLTAEEIEMISFPDLQLTVLSACNTGLGEIDSEGVWGLQRAFRIAGTRNLICSIAEVDDYWTTQFMDAFYEQAVQGKTIYDSFHTAQRWLHRELPDSPEVWSSFILIE